MTPWNDATKYLRIIAVAFWIYDWFLTVPAELRLYRKQKSIFQPSLACLLLVTVRYFGAIALSTNILGFMGRFWTDAPCSHFFRFILAMQCVASAASHVVFIVRTVAICKNSQRMLVRLGLIGLLTVTLEVFSQFWSFPDYRVGSAGTCVTEFRSDASKNVAWLFYVSAFLFDCIILTLTYRGLAIDYIARHKGRPQSSGSSFTDVLWGSSLVYFVATTVFNLINLVFYAIFKTDTNSSVFCTLGIAITSMMSGRVILNLHDYAHNHEPGSFQVSDYYRGNPVRSIGGGPSPGVEHASYNLHELRTADASNGSDQPDEDLDNSKQGPMVLEDDIGLRQEHGHGGATRWVRDEKKREFV